MATLRALAGTVTAAIVLVRAAPAQDFRHNLELQGQVLFLSEEGVYSGTPYSVQGSLTGVRAALRAGPFYITGRYLKGTTGAVGDSLPDRQLEVWTAGGGLFIAGPVRVDVESWYRRANSALGDQRFAGLRVGLGLGGELVPGLVSARFVAHYAVHVSTSQLMEDPNLAWDGSVEIGIRPPRVPLRFAVAYELQRLDFASGAGSQNVGQTIRQGRFGGISLSLGLDL